MMHIETKCVHGCSDNHNDTGAISVPIYQSSTFSRSFIGEGAGYDYSRLQNPTRECVEKLVAKLENGYDALAFSSGMAAFSALMELFSPGDTILATDDLYGGTVRFLNHISVKNGIRVIYTDTSNIANIEANLTPSLRAIFIETPSNPMMQVTDIKAVAEIAHKNNALLIVDNTFLSPYFQQPFSLGADIVLHSGTKFLGGHNDVLAGFLVVNSAELSEKLRFIIKTTGAGLAPFDSWLLIRGLKTLAIRMDKQQENALKIAEWLSNHPNVKAVHYVGLPTHPQYELNKRQASGFGSMISFEVHDEATAHAILKKVKVILFAESLGGTETLITYPITQTHADVPLEQRLKKGITERLLRLSVGIEHVDDIIADLQQALEDPK